jgi:hypothetical protein
MNIHSSYFTAFALSMSVMATYLAGCHECAWSDAPCAGEASYFSCTDSNSPTLRFVERECPGIEPSCVDLPDKQHSCEDKRSPALCPTLRVLQPPGLVSPSELLRVADLDGNGRPDLLLEAQVGSGPTAGTALVRVMQSSDGTFGAPLEILRRDQAFRTIYAADLDGDKRLDLLEQDGLRSVTARFGQADGSFSLAMTGVSLARELLDVSDSDADGSAEVIGSDGDVLAILSPPPELMPRATMSVSLPIPVEAQFPSRIYSAKTRDLDGDGRPELIAHVTDGSDKVSREVFTRMGDAWIADPRPWDAGPMGEFEYIADFDHDAIPDRVGWEDRDAVRPRVVVATGDGAGKFREHEARQLPERGSIHMADFDGDGNLDIASLGQYVTVLRGRGDGSLEKPQSFGLPEVHAVPGAASVVVGIDPAVPTMTMADLDADGAPDLIGADSEKVFVAPNACLTASVSP